MIEIFDPRDSKKYKVKDLKVFYHYLPKLGKVKCVEYTVIGKHFEWRYWMLAKDLKKANPELILEEVVNSCQ